MKIVLVTPRIDLGGGQRYIIELANYWVKEGYDISIITLRDTDAFYTISKKVTIIKLGYSDSGKLKKIFYGFKTLLKLRKNIKQIQPDFVLSILSSTNILTLFSTYFLETKVFIEDVMSPFRKRKKIEKYFRKFLYKKASGVIALTSTAKKFIEKETGVKNVKIIPNPISNILIAEKKQKEKIILNVGRLVSEKGQKYFLEVCAKLNDPDWKFIILGDGPLREVLKKQAIKLKIENQVLMPGAVKNIEEWLAKASIFAFPSISESFPIALLEAMSAGLPCVSFDCQTGPKDIINDGVNGVLVPVGDIKLFTLRINELMNDPVLRNRYSAEAKKVKDKYSIEKISNEILEFCTS